ncbi:DUF5107 domain-containing protein, partial [Rhizobium johnstonii]
NVINPALVGLAGSWISGGVEFNWPQHHRPATYLPVDARIEREDDGAVVVWHRGLYRAKLGQCPACDTQQGWWGQKLPVAGIH